VRENGRKPVPGRRRVLALLAGVLVAPKSPAQVPNPASPMAPFAPVVPGYALRFPYDEGSHPDFRTEWWYVTGWLNADSGRPLGFQITFFRTRFALKGQNPSSFTPHQVMIAHAALSEPVRGRLQHDERIARAAFDLAGARPERLEVNVDDWWFRQEGSAYVTSIPARDFKIDFTFGAMQPPLLQGTQGLSHKGPHPESASYYYSLPQLQVTGTLTRMGKAAPVAGTAWLDHEWSSSYLAPEAVGWDWTGINLADGAALMAFRMRDRQGGSFWAGGAYRRSDGGTRTFGPAEIGFAPLRHWRSPRTGTGYPVSWTVRAGAMQIELQPLMDDQENDTRLSTGTIYWEGAVHALQHGKPVGRGYLELTGYWKPMRL
jgi:predicted secreted hydrolase